MKKGYTGKLTSDGRALVKYQGRVFAVPARGLGIAVPKAANQNAKWTPQQRGAQATRLAALSQSGSRLSGSGNGPRPPTGPQLTAANQNSFDRIATKSKTPSAAERLHYRAAVHKASQVPGGKIMLGRNPSYIQGASRSKSQYFFIPAKVWNSYEKKYRDNGLSEKDIQMAMFDEYNRKFLDRAIDRGDRIFLSSPTEEMSHGIYSSMEIEHLGKRGYKLSDDGLEMILENGR